MAANTKQFKPCGPARRYSAKVLADLLAALAQIGIVTQASSVIWQTDRHGDNWSTDRACRAKYGAIECEIMVAGDGCGVFVGMTGDSKSVLADAQFKGGLWIVKPHIAEYLAGELRHD